MECDEKKLKEYSRRILLTRLKLLCDNPFYGLLLMHISFSLTDDVELCGFKNKTIYYNPKFLDAANDDELRFSMEHEILHIALRHGITRGVDMSRETFRLAADIVVNSNILKSHGGDKKSITVNMNGGVQEHIAPDGKEGFNYTVEELYNMLAVVENKADDQSDDETEDQNNDDSQKNKNNKKNKGGADINAKGNAPSGKIDGLNKGRSGKSNIKRKGGKDDDDTDNDGDCGKNNKGKNGKFDDHCTSDESEDNYEDQIWTKRILDTAEAVIVRDPSKSRGLIPAFAERMLNELRNPQTDWRTLLQNFIQEEVCDYSFSPPDRRFDDSPFFLPDFNDTEITVKDILFMIDTSGSMSDEMITAAYSEIKGAIDQFNGKLKGWLGFFDAAVIEPKQFSDEDEFVIIRPKGGGGTNFEIIFDYVRDNMQDNLPASIIILTDGFAPFPKESAAMEIPVFWLLNNKSVDPPWGKVARIKV